MEWSIDKSKPVCPQLTEQIGLRIAKGELRPNEKLPSVREIALGAGVNPNTVQKALELLEGKNLIYSVRGSGWYVGENTEIHQKLLDDFTRNKIKGFIADMNKIGFSLGDIKKIMEDYENE